MPSLDELNEFKSSFHNIANEKEDVSSKKLPFDDLELPTTEAPPFNYLRSMAASKEPVDNFKNTNTADIDGDGFDINNFLNDLPSNDVDNIFNNLQTEHEQAESSGLDDFLLSLNGGQSEENAPEWDDTPLSETFAETQSEPFTNYAQDDTNEGSFPTDLLSGFSEDMESSSSDEPLNEPLTDDFSIADDFTSDNSFDLGGESLYDERPEPNANIEENDASLDDLFSGMNFSENDDTESSEQFGDDFSFEPQSGSQDEDFSFEPQQDTLDENFSFESQDNFETEPSEQFGDDFSFETQSGLQDENFSFEPQQDTLDENFSFEPQDNFETEPSEQFGDDFSFESQQDTQGEGSSFDNFDTDDFSVDENFEFNVSEETGNEESAGFPPFDEFNSDFSFDTTPEGVESEFHEQAFETDEFHIPGLEDIFDKTRTKIDINVPEKKESFFKRRKQKTKTETVPDVNEVEEIALSQDDLNKLLLTLSVYPLNLRIACEEIIAEQVILPQQLSKLIRLLVNNANAKETADHVESITGNKVVIPKSFEKNTGAAFEEEQASFSYIFKNNFLPTFRLIAVIALLVTSVAYLSYRFIYTPLRAESIYRRGYERIAAGEYQRANALFQQAFALHRNRNWFYAYAEAFRDRRRFMLAEGKYQELLRHFPRDRRGILDFADLLSNYMFNYERANTLLQRELLDFFPNDFDGLLAAGDNFLAWADSDPERFFDRYEDARFSFARLLELNGWQPEIVERMLRFFIRTDNLGEVIHLRNWFESDPRRRRMSTETLAELGGYLLDKRLETPRGVPNPFVEYIESVRDMLLQAVMEDPFLPEPHYHLARHHHALGNVHEERLTLENAIRAFDLARTESVRRRVYRVDAHYRYAQLLINNGEFFPAEAELVRAIELFDEFRRRNLLRASPQLGRLYALRGDLEFYTKTGDRQAAENALRYYRLAEIFGHAPPEVLYRMGAAYYQLEDWENALQHFFRASAEMPFNRRILFALGNATFQRSDYFAAQGYFNRLLDILEGQRARLTVLLPNNDPHFIDIGERLMMARNNAGAVYEALAHRTGNTQFRSRAMSLYAESASAWDAVTRNPETMTRMRLADIPGAPGINLGFLNANNLMRPVTDYTPAIFVRIDRDVEEPSRWERLAPFGR